MICLPFSVCFICLFSYVGGEDTFASTAHLRIAANGEIPMRKTLKNYLVYEERRLNDLTKLMEGIRKIHSSAAANDTHEYVGNPLNALHLIRRFATTWRNIWDKIADFSHYEALRKSTEEIGFFLPVDADYEGAKRSILRLQDVYNLKAKDLAKGVVAGKRAQPLSQKALYDIGMLCMEKKEYRQALDWFLAAKTHAVPPLGNMATIMAVTSDAYIKLGDWEKAGSAALESLKLHPSNSTLMRRAANLALENYHILMEEDDDDDDDDDHDDPALAVVPSWYMAYTRLCREAERKKRKLNSTHNGGSLHCVYRGVSPPYLRYKVEVVSADPRIEIVHDVTSDRETRALIGRSIYMMVRARVGNLQEAKVSNDRIGKVAWLWEQFNLTSIGRVNSRIGRVTGLNVTFPAGEPLQVVNYGIGGQYEPHNDHDERRLEKLEVPTEIAKNGDRMATFMIYLSDVHAGGATVFPNLNLFINPTKNSAVLWYNYKDSGEPDNRMLHAGCPVLVGDKWIANKWIREFGQEFRRPCPTRTRAR